MKLKRFLLRYDPPGIGLEVEDETGALEVRHRDLHPAGQVSSPADVASLVEDLCGSEPDLLNVRKHGTALTGLFSRLYQVERIDSPPSDKDGGRSQRSNQADGTEADTLQSDGIDKDRDQLAEGRRVVLVGLRGKLSGYNGVLATLLKAKITKDKYEVVISGGRSEQFETLKVKGSEHLLPLLTIAPPLAIGTCVVLVRLRNHTELNGCIGRVVDCQERGQRYEIRTAETGQLFRVKFDNVVPVEANSAADIAKENMEPNSEAVGSATGSAAGGSFEDGSGDGRSRTLPTSPSGASMAQVELLDPGAIIEIVGLKSNMSYNGEQAKILLVDSESLRYEVRMSDGSVKKLRAENARLVALAPCTPQQPNADGYSRGGGATNGVPLRLSPSPTERSKRKADMSLPRGDWNSPSPELGEMKPGAIVQLQGLRSAPYLNGQRAEVMQDLGDRVEIRLEDGSIKKVRKENLEMIAPR
mmetsp:Transcript_39314/g.69148  ORF Transcript_39314/g.69148 Transcript_39314/m.69148 type:complete len:472 (-) Transcript_39314:192-1607(-)